MVAIMGTSTCHVMSHDALVEVPGMCGVVDGGIVAGRWGYEAGQSGVGDIFGWFTHTSVPAAYAEAAAARQGSRCTSTSPGWRPSRRWASTDWSPWTGTAGNRSVLVDHEPVSGAVVGLTLEHQAGGRLPGAPGGDRVRHPGHRGDVPRQRASRSRSSWWPGDWSRTRCSCRSTPTSPGCRSRSSGHEQGPALGSAIHAAVAAGVYPDVPTAAKTMGKVRKDVFLPDEGRAQAYDQLFEQYVALHDHFGRATTTMRRLKAIRRAAVASRAGSET